MGDEQTTEAEDHKREVKEHQDRAEALKDELVVDDEPIQEE